MNFKCSALNIEWLLIASSFVFVSFLAYQFSFPPPDDVVCHSGSVVIFRGNAVNDEVEILDSGVIRFVEQESKKEINITGDCVVRDQRMVTKNGLIKK